MLKRKIAYWLYVRPLVGLRALLWSGSRKLDNKLGVLISNWTLSILP